MIHNEGRHAEPRPVAFRPVGLPVPSAVSCYSEDPIRVAACWLLAEWELTFPSLLLCCGVFVPVIKLCFVQPSSCLVILTEVSERKKPLGLSVCKRVEGKSKRFAFMSSDGGLMVAMVCLAACAC